MNCADEFKICGCCERVRPLDDFRRRHRDGRARVNQCRSCHNETERLRRANRCADRRAKAIGRFVRRVKSEDRPDKIATLVEAANETFGGFERLVEAWVEHLISAAEQRLGSKKTLDSFLAIVKLAHAYEAERRREADADDLDIAALTPAEKQQFKLEATEQLIRHRPELAIAAAERLGWTVVLPTTRSDSRV